MKIYTNWAFLRPVLHLPLWWLYYRKPSFSMYLSSTQEHTIPIYVKILQILFQLELSCFWIEDFDIFWLFMYHYVIKSSVCIGSCQKWKESNFRQNSHCERIFLPWLHRRGLDDISTHLMNQHKEIKYPWKTFLTIMIWLHHDVSGNNCKKQFFVSIHIAILQLWEWSLARDLRKTLESVPLCITDLFQNKPVPYF